MVYIARLFQGYQCKPLLRLKHFVMGKRTLWDELTPAIALYYPSHPPTPDPLSLYDLFVLIGLGGKLCSSLLNAINVVASLV